MRLLQYRHITKIYFIFGLLVASIVFIVVIEPKDRIFINGITIFGTYLSLFGIIISYLQIKSFKVIDEETKKNIVQSLQRLNQLVVVADLSKAIKIIEEIQQFIQQHNYPIVLIRMKDLKSILIQAAHNDEANKLEEYDSFCGNLNELKADIRNMHEYITGYKKNGLNFSKITNHLEELSTTLTAFEHKLKNKKNDS
jgi:hypothetical protein